MVGACKNDAARAVFAGSFIQVVHTDDVGGQDFVKWPFDRHTSQMHHAVHTLEQLIDRLGVLQGHGHDLLASFGSLQLRNIADPQCLAVGFEARTQHAA